MATSPGAGRTCNYRDLFACGCCAGKAKRIWPHSQRGSKSLGVGQGAIPGAAFSLCPENAGLRVSG